MSASVVSLAPSNASDAAFRAWAQGIETAILALGWVNTSDTGQLNLSTMTVPVAAATFAGYRMYRMDDALQATAPCYLKIEFGTGVSTNVNPGLRFSYATATNGAGTLIGIVSATFTYQPNTTNASVMPCYFSGSSNRLNMLLFCGNTSLHITFNLERISDESNNPDGDGFLSFAHSSTATTNRQYQQLGNAGTEIPTTGALNQFPTLVPVNGTMSGPNGLGIYPFFPTAGRPLPPSFLGGMFASTDIPKYSAVAFSAFSSNYKWLVSELVAVTNYVFAMRFD